MTHPSVDHSSIQAPQVLRTHLELSAGARDGEPSRILVKVNSLGKPRPGLPPPRPGGEVVLVQGPASDPIFVQVRSAPATRRQSGLSGQPYMTHH